jgi:hypothetical protein
MKTKRSFQGAALALLLSTLDSQLSTAHAQGSLTPPGAPAPVMKSLDQIEPRTPISSLPFTINKTGSYYLTTNLTGTTSAAGILISANDVTLDLNGFALIGVAGSLDGVSLTNAWTNLVVLNGTIRDWGGRGIDATSARNSQFERLRILSNGGVGLLAGPESLIRDCLVQGSILNDGFFASAGSTFSGCTSIGNGGSGFNTYEKCLATGCLAKENAGYGFYPADDCAFVGCTALANQNVGIQAGLYNGCRIQDCTVTGNTNAGIACGSQALVSGCLVRGNSGDGILAVTRCRIVNNHCVANGSGSSSYAGINLIGFSNYVEGNTLAANRNNGLNVSGGNANRIVKNSVMSNLGTAYNVSPLLDDCPLATSAATATNAWANFQ